MGSPASHQGLNPANRRALLKVLSPPPKQVRGEGMTAEEMGDNCWVRPETVAEIKFAEWTTAGVLRHAEFVILRDDKNPIEVGMESPH